MFRRQAQSRTWTTTTGREEEDTDERRSWLDTRQRSREAARAVEVRGRMASPAALRRDDLRRRARADASLTND